MKETWKNVVGYEGLYYISNKGRVKSTYRSQKILKQAQDKDGYLIVCLHKDKRQKNHKIHRLVLEAFVGMSDDQICDHVDRNNRNNCITNLRWVDYSTNNRNVDRSEYTSQYYGVYFKKDVKKWTAAVKYNQKTYSIGRFDNEIEAAFAYDQFIIKSGIKRDLNCIC